jgi:hypothetical protein
LAGVMDIISRFVSQRTTVYRHTIYLSFVIRLARKSDELERLRAVVVPNNMRFFNQKDYVGELKPGPWGSGFFYLTFTKVLLNLLQTTETLAGHFQDIHTSGM